MAAQRDFSRLMFRADTRRLQVARLAMLLAVVVAFGTVGYHFLLHWSWLESIYMTVITITTVGFGEVQALNSAGQTFTIILVLMGVGIVAYSATTMTSLVMETQIRSVFWKRRMEKKIKRLRGHFIICGFGRTGKAVRDSLEQSGVPHVVVEGDPEVVKELTEKAVNIVEGDATQDETLQKAGIEHARGLAAALGSDADNVYVVLSARQMKPELTLVSWASSKEAEGKIRRAGADHVMSPHVLGGRRIANLLTTPNALEFLDHAMGVGGDQNIRIGEIEITAGSKVIGNSLFGLGVGRELGVIMIGIRRADGKMLFNPPADQIFAEGDVLIGIGSQKEMERFRAIVV